MIYRLLVSDTMRVHALETRVDLVEDLLGVLYDPLVKLLPQSVRSERSRAILTIPTIISLLRIPSQLKIVMMSIGTSLMAAIGGSSLNFKHLHQDCEPEPRETRPYLAHL